jgi:Raf kinase inhibitor-like YbhB/YbcL family protein
MARTIHRIASTTAALAILAVLTGSAGGAYARGDRGDLTFRSPAFPNGAPIPVRFACRDVGGQDIAPSLAWSAPPGDGYGLALVMDDPDAVGGLFVHWIVFGMHPGPGSSAEGQTQPGYGMLQPNGNGDRAYRAPCPPAGSGIHHYRFTLYQVPSNLEVPAGGADAATIAQASTAAFTFTGTYGPL